MKHLSIFSLLTLSLVTLSVVGCSPETEKDKEQEKQAKKDKAWIQANENFYTDVAKTTDAEGKLFYETLVPVWNTGESVLIHYYNDRSQTEKNLRPLYNSTVAIKYHGELYNGTRFDDSYSNTDSLTNFQVNNVVGGMTIALTNMHVGDSVRVVMPADLGYGSKASKTVPAYSTLLFNIKLVDIPNYETQ